MKYRIYVQTHGIAAPKFVLLTRDGRTKLAERIEILGPSDCVYDEELGKFVVATDADVRLTD